MHHSTAIVVFNEMEARYNGRKPEEWERYDLWLQTDDSESTCCVLKQYERRGRCVGAVGGICWRCFTVMGGKWTHRITQRYSEVFCGGGGTGQAAKWAKDGEIKSGSLW